MADKPTTFSAVKHIFDEVDTLNPESTLLSDENSLSIVNDWIDTGAYALNAIISGSLYKGIPRGRLTGLTGPSQAGKSLIINKMIANAQKKGYFAAVWDTENALDKSFAEAVGVDPDRVKYYPVDTIENCRNQIIKLLTKVIEANDPSLKIIIAIDSLGNLSFAKEQADAEANKDAADMGARARALKSMLRSLTYPSAKARVPILFTNHIYDNPTAMYPELVNRQSGGKSPIYLASVLLQLGLRNEKIKDNETEESVAIAHNVSGTTITAMTVKNRFAPPYLKTELYNNYRTGLNKYEGVYQMALAFGVITEEGRSYVFDGEKIGKSSEWKTDIEKVWEPKIMPALEKVLQEKLCYSSNSEQVVSET